MSLGLVSPLLNRGVRSRWLASLPVAGSKMVTIDSNGDTSFQDVPVAAWGSITGTLSAQTDLQNALNAKANTSHSHVISDVTGLQTALNLKADSSALAGYQPLDSDLTAIAALSTTSFGRSVLTQADGASVRALIGAGTSSFDGAFSSLSGRPTTLSGYGITDGITSAAVAAGYLPLSGGTLTGAVTSNLGTLTASTPALSINQTWNNAAVNFSLINGSITPTAASGSYWFNFTSTSNWGAGSAPFFRASARDGAIEISSMWGQGSLLLGSIAIRLEGQYGNGFLVKDYAGTDIVQINTEYGDTGIQAQRAAMPIGWSGLKLRRDAADTLALQRSTNAQRFNLYGTYTDASNYRRLYLSSTTAGAFTLGVEGAGTGASGNTLTILSNSTLAFNVNGSERMQIDTAGRVGVGISSGLLAGLTVGMVNGALPNLRLEQATISIPSYSATGYNPALGSSTIGVLASIGSIMGGLNVNGFSTTADERALMFSGISGKTNPTSNGVVTFIAWKHNGTNDRTTLTGSEICFDFSNGFTSLFRVAANGMFGLGGLTNSHPGFKRNGTAINFRLADDSADAPITAGAGTFSGNVTTSRVVFNATNNMYIRDNGSGLILSYYGGEIYRFGYGELVIDLSGQGSVRFGSQTVIQCQNGGLTVVQGGTSVSQVWRIANTYTDASNFRTLNLSWSSYGGVNYGRFGIVNAGTGIADCPLVLSPSGTGAFILGPMPDGTATGGNARGTGAIDIQTGRNAANQVASQPYNIAIGVNNRANADLRTGIAIGRNNDSRGRGSSICIGNDCIAGDAVQNDPFIAIGQNCTASEYGSIAIGHYCTGSSVNSIAIGVSNTASGYYSFALGRGSTASRYGQRSFAASQYSTNGDLQHVQFTMIGKTVDATPVNLNLDNSSARLVLTAGRIFVFNITISGHKSDGSQHAIYSRRVVIKRVVNTTTLIENQTIGTDYEDNAGTDVAITADDTNEALQIAVTGIAAETWRWEANITGSEITYGT